MSKAETLEWARETTPLLMGGILQEGYRKGFDRVKEEVRTCLAYDGGGIAALKGNLLSLLYMDSVDHLYGIGLVDGTRDAARAVAKRLPELQEALDIVLNPHPKPKARTPTETDTTCSLTLSRYKENLVISLYRSGWSVRDIARRIGKSRPTVYHVIDKNGIERRRKHGKG